MERICVVESPHKRSLTKCLIELWHEQESELYFNRSWRWLFCYVIRLTPPNAYLPSNVYLLGILVKWLSWRCILRSPRRAAAAGRVVHWQPKLLLLWLCRGVHTKARLLLDNSQPMAEYRVLEQGYSYPKQESCNLHPGTPHQHSWDFLRTALLSEAFYPILCSFSPFTGVRLAAQSEGSSNSCSHFIFFHRSFT